MFLTEGDSFKRQETTFVLLNLFVLAALLLIHTVFEFHYGAPPRLLMAVLAAAFLGYVVELIWIQGLTPPFSPQTMLVLTWGPISGSLVVSFVLASLAFRQDTQYFALMIVPILQAAFRLSLRATCAVVCCAVGLTFFWVWAYFRMHPPVDISEYYEAATISLMFAVLGPLVWLLVNDLRKREANLAQAIEELEQAERRLMMEEKLAAVGRLSTAIAHEIRNPVAMISSALATAFREELNQDERKEMFQIAAAEASRLEKLTSDFLCYARPRPLTRQPTDIRAFIEYVASVCRLKASECAIKIRLEGDEHLEADIDIGQMQQALVNIVMNAIESSHPGTSISIRAVYDHGWARIDVENRGGPIPANAVDLLFEPFFTTKPKGTGLGLAIARNIVRAQGGDLILATNEKDVIRFSITAPLALKRTTEEEPSRV